MDTKKQKETCNGWSNRSTWLVELHMQNTNKDITDLYKSAAVESDTIKQFRNRVVFLMPHTSVGDEEQFYFDEIEWEELWDANRLTV